jgi:TonB family protein
MIYKPILACGALCVLSFTYSSYAQTPTPSPSSTQKECTVPSVNPVDVNAKVIAKPDPKFSRADRDRYRGYVMTLRAILCGSGKVTDVVVTQGITHEMDSAAIDAAHLIEFTPAEKDGKKVSRPVTLKYIVKD